MTGSRPNFSLLDINRTAASVGEAESPSRVAALQLPPRAGKRRFRVGSFQNYLSPYSVRTTHCGFWSNNRTVFSGPLNPCRKCLMSMWFSHFRFSIAGLMEGRKCKGIRPQRDKNP